ncbi:MAG: hypothetical protein IKM61_03910 [Eubacteriaceae bacterium]|nr:hypothetical protein [Eubacteriaceae bacterium]
MTNEKVNIKVEIPEGTFCGGNCSTCVHWERNNRDSNDRGYCSYYTTYYHPSERNGCINHEER